MCADTRHADAMSATHAEEAADGPTEPIEASFDDYYAVLGVSADATRKELHAAFRRQAKQWHPDRFALADELTRDVVEQRMRLLTEAYRTLNDPQQREVYDASLRGDAASKSVFSVPWAPFTDNPVVHEYSTPGHATSNTNGAGQFFGALALVLGLALLAGAISGGSFNGAVGSLVILLLVGLLALAAAMFSPESPMARWAYRVMEGEPRGFTAPSPRKKSQPASGASETVASTDDDTAVRDAHFERLVSEALASVPSEFESYLQNVLVQVEHEPDAETLQAAGVPEGYTLLGLYQGVSLNKRGAADTGPDVITIYQGPIERRRGGDEGRIREQARATVLHELAHHFGIDHDDMPEWVK